MNKVGFIDLQAKAVDKLVGNIYVFSGRPGRYELENSMEMEYAGDHAFPLDTRLVGEFYLSLPVKLLNFRVLRLPFSDREKLLKVVPFELEGLMLEGPENVVFDVTVLGPAGDAFDVLVTYVEKGLLRELLDKLSPVGIDPQVVTSIELQTGVKEGTEGIALKLIDGRSPAPEERMAAAKNELLNHTINLRTGTFSYTKDAEKVEKRVKVTSALLIALALIINAYLIFGMVIVKREVSAVKGQMRSTYSALFPAEKNVADELYQLKAHIKEMKEKGDALIGIHPLQFLLDLAQKNLQGVAFSEIALDRDIITAKGESASMDDIDKVKTRLSEFLTDVTVSDIKPSAGGKTFFTVIARGRKR
jgi:type II secretory pathway component PulL